MCNIEKCCYGLHDLHYSPNSHRSKLIFVPCIIRRSRKNQQYALICTTPLFYILAPTCYGSSLPSSGSLLDHSELLEIQIHKMLYTPVLLSVIYFRYSTNSICISRKSEGSKQLPNDGRLLPKHV
jgi:hypothetical protein